MVNTDAKNIVWNEIRKVLNEAVTVRRHLHMHPEVSGKEYDTAAFIVSKLTKAGITPKLHINRTAVSATITNGKGPLIVLRADIDALPIQEETGLPYSSKNDGIMHACGHDMHTACLLGAVRVLKNLKSLWRGTVIALFQPSEEIEPGGASQLIEEGVFPGNASSVFGLHVNSEYNTGTIAVKKGIDYAGVLAFDVTIKGKGGHGGTPEKTIDPIMCTSQLILQLQTIISREKSPFFPAVITIGSLHAGTRRNIIPETASFYGTIRCHSREYLDTLKDRICSLVKLTAQSYRCESAIAFEKPYPPVNNDPVLCERFMSRFSSLTDASRCFERPMPTMYAEDFSFYQEITPGIFVHLGVKPKRKKSVSHLHSPHFSPDEDAIPTGIAAHVAFVLENGGNNEI